MRSLVLILLVAAVTGSEIQTQDDNRSWFSWWFSSDSSCGDDYYGTEGTIYSPFHPGDYPNNVDCGWSITAPDWAVITISFESFETEHNYDFVKIWDGDDVNAPLLVELSGSLSTVEDVTSSGNSLYITFTSDGSGPESGFKLDWFATPTTDAPPLGCYSCIGCENVDDDTDIESSREFLACFVAIELGTNHFVIRGGSPDYFEDGVCRHEGDDVFVCYCDTDMCNSDDALLELLKEQ